MLSGKKLIKINITIPWEADMMDTYDYAQECVRALKEADIPEMELRWSVERVEDSKEDKNGTTKNN